MMNEYTYYGEPIEVTDCDEYVTDKGGKEYNLYTDGTDYYIDNYDDNEGAEKDLTKVNEFCNMIPENIEDALLLAQQLVNGTDSHTKDVFSKEFHWLEEEVEEPEPEKEYPIVNHPMQGDVAKTGDMYVLGCYTTDTPIGNIESMRDLHPDVTMLSPKWKLQTSYLDDALAALGEFKSRTRLASIGKDISGEEHYWVEITVYAVTHEEVYGKMQLCNDQYAKYADYDTESIKRAGLEKKDG